MSARKAKRLVWPSDLPIHVQAMQVALKRTDQSATRTWNYIHGWCDGYRAALRAKPKPRTKRRVQA